MSSETRMMGIGPSTIAGAYSCAAADAADGPHLVAVGLCAIPARCGMLTRDLLLQI
jgi:hypothetical protein